MYSLLRQLRAVSKEGAEPIEWSATYRENRSRSFEQHFMVNSVKCSGEIK